MARAPPASLLQELVLDRGALGAEVDKEDAGSRACPELPQLIVMGPFHVAPLLDLREGQGMLVSSLVPSRCRPEPHTIPTAGLRATGSQLQTGKTHMLGRLWEAHTGGQSRLRLPRGGDGLGGCSPGSGTAGTRY